MRLTRLTIQQLPGIDEGFTLRDLAPGVNMVIGPNGVGKSSLVRALKFLIREPGNQDPSLTLSADFQDDSGHWQVDRSGRQREWRYEGKTTTAPRLPDADLLNCYWLSMEDLLQADGRDQQLLAELRRALGGGCDLAALREQPPFAVGRQIGQRQARALREAQRSLKQVEADYEHLRRQEAQLPTLEEELEAAEQAEKQLKQLQAALALIESCEERESAEARLATFPEAMARLRGDELERLEALESDKERLSRDIQQAEQAIETLQASLEGMGLAEKRPDSETLEARREDLSKLAHWQAQSHQCRVKSETARQKEGLAAEQMGGGECPPKLDPESLSRAEALARRFNTKQAEYESLSRQAERATAPDQAELDSVRRAEAALTDWLAAPDEPQPPRAALATTALGGVLALSGGVSAILMGGEQAGLLAGMGRIGGILALSGSVWAGWRMRGDARANDKDDARRRFLATGLAAPEDWQRSAVSARLNTLQETRQSLEQQLLTARQAEEAAQQLKLVDAEFRQLEAEKQAMAEDLGLDPALTANSLDRFVRLVNDWQQARDERLAADSELAELDQAARSIRHRLRDFLGHWQAAPEMDDLADLKASLSKLSRRVEQAQDLEQSLRTKRQSLAERRETLNSLKAQYADFFQVLGLEAGDRPGLQRRCEQYKEWLAANEAMRAARQREAERKAALANEPALLAQVAQADEAGLHQAAREAEMQAARYSPLYQQVIEIRTRLQDAGKDQRLEAAMAEVETARADLADRRYEALLAQAGQFLLDEVETEHQSAFQPAMLKDAREQFQRFTHHRWDFELDPEWGLAALDLAAAARRPLEALSSGTRMQLLLAVRLSWVRHAEKDRQSLPIFLDEALTTSDEERFAQVAASLDLLAREEGRQIFYLSARRHEAILWERATGHQPHAIDLAAVRFSDPQAEAEDFVLPESRSLPRPEGQSAETYAASLGIHPIDPWQDAGQIPIFYLLRDDLVLLHHLMEHWRIVSLGPLERLLLSSAADKAITQAEQRARLRGRIAAVRSWHVAWRQGRGRPVDRNALEASGAVSEAFIDRVSDLAQRVGGEGEALLDALRGGRVSRFQKRNISELETWLEDNAYLDPASPLDAEGREHQALLDSAQHTPAEETRRIVRWLEAGLAGD